MTVPGDLLSGALTEIARDLREKRVTARELIEAAIARHERFGERLHAHSLLAPELQIIIDYEVLSRSYRGEFDGVRFQGSAPPRPRV